METDKRTTPGIILYLAPLKGITDATFRSSFARFFPGFDLSISPFLSTSKGNCISESALKEVQPANNRFLPLIPQILTNQPENFLCLAQQLSELGYKEVNWNLGCPSRTVTPKKKGAGLLFFTDRIQEILDTVFKTTPCKISIKMRLGMESPEDIFKLLPILNQYPLETITIHPRTGNQFYEGEVDLDAFEQCLALTRHPIIYSGDIIHKKNFDQLAHRFPTVNQWMIGRGAVMNPFLPAAIKGLAETQETQKFNTLLLFHDELFARYKEKYSGSVHLLGKMKALWHYLVHFFPEDPKLLKKIRKIKSLRFYKPFVSSLFEEKT